MKSRQIHGIRHQNNRGKFAEINYLNFKKLSICSLKQAVFGNPPLIFKCLLPCPFAIQI